MLQLPYLLGHGRGADKLAVECRAGSVAIAVLACATWFPAHGKEATVPPGEAGACPRSAFHVIVDVGHGVASPGADSARGVTEYSFNLGLADVIKQARVDAGFDNTVRMITATRP
jgi:N-acetylmuramoyl-L-alanine amidase